MDRGYDKNNNAYDCIVIGAGAAGLFYAAGDCLAGVSQKNGPARKLLLEKTSRPGQKLLMSGSGMCNITHGGSIKEFIDKYGDNGRLIRRCLYAHNNLELMKTMESIGVPLIEREDDKVFPVSMRARDVLDALLGTISYGRHYDGNNGETAAKRNPSGETTGWKIECGADVSEIKIQFRQFNESMNSEMHTNPVIQIVLRDGRIFTTDKLVIATGGSSYPATGSDGSFFIVLQRDLGLKIAKPRPALAPVYIQDFSYSDLAGISFDDVTVTCNNTVVDYPEYDQPGKKNRKTDKEHVTRGGLLITHRGLSGPAILHISQYVRPGSTIRIDYLPGINAEEMTNALKAAREKSGQSITNYLANEFGLPKAFVAKQFEIICNKASDNIMSSNPFHNSTRSQSGNKKKTKEAISAQKRLSDLSNNDIRAIVRLFKECEYSISGTGGWNDAMITAGGVCLDQIDLKTMRVKEMSCPESAPHDLSLPGNSQKKEANDSCHPLPDIRIIGEALDINGDTGGYNLQFAYSSAMAALSTITSPSR